jgi:hypothetical protein
VTTFTRIRSALPTNDAALRAEIETALAGVERRLAASGAGLGHDDHLEGLAGLLDHRQTARDPAEREMIDRSIRVKLRRLTAAGTAPAPAPQTAAPAPAAQTAAPAPAASARPTTPAATTSTRTATTAPSAVKAPPAADPAPATFGTTGIPLAAPAAGPLAAEIAAGERALREGRAAIIGGGARTARTHVARDLTAEYEAADRALAAGKAKIVKGGAVSFPQPEPEPVESASRPLVERAKAQWDRDPGLRAEFGYRFDMFLAYRRQAERQAARAGRR